MLFHSRGPQTKCLCWLLWLQPSANTGQIIYLSESFKRKHLVLSKFFQQPSFPYLQQMKTLNTMYHQSMKQNILQSVHNVACSVANEDKLTLCESHAELQSERSFQYPPALHFDCARFRSPLRLGGQSVRFRESVGTRERASLQCAESSRRWGMPAILHSKCLAPPGIALLQPPGLKESQLDWDPTGENPPN